MTVAIVWLHLYFLFHAGGLWRDEVNLVNLSTRHSLSAMDKDSFPVLMPLLVKSWSALGLGHSDLDLRVLGMLIGLGICGALWLAAWRAHRPPLVALALFGLNASVITYGDSLRAYGLGSLLVVLMVAAAWAFLQKPSWARTGIFAATAISSVQALYQNAVFVAAVCCGAWAISIWRKNGSAALKILLVAVAAAASWLPYWSRLVSMPQATAPLRTGFNSTMTFVSFDIIAGFPLLQYSFVWELLALGIVLRAGATVLARPPAPGASFVNVPSRELPVFAGMTLLAGVVGFGSFIWLASLATEAWYFLPLLAAAAICFDLGLPPLHRYFRAVFFGFIAATALVGAVFAQRDLNWRFTNIDLLTRQLESEAATNDFVIVTPWYCGVSFARYFKSATPWTTLPPLTDHSTQRFDLVAIQMRNPNAIRPVLNQIAATLQSGHRVWIVGSMRLPTPGEPPPPDFVPPTSAHSAWADTPAISVWAAQTAWFLQTHSLHFECVAATTNDNVNEFENLKLFMAEGWRDSGNGSVPAGSVRGRP